MKYDTALDSTFTEVNVNDDPQVRGQPGLNEFTITTFIATDPGNYFDIYVTVYTREGTYLNSDRASILLADVPLKPSSIPTLTQALSSASTLYMNYPVLSMNDNGGTMILSYSLEWDSDFRSPGEWVSLIGYPIDSLATQYTISHGVRKGQLYRFRYRARNFYGWGAYSDVATILAA